MKKIIGFIAFIAFSNIYGNPEVPVLWKDVPETIPSQEYSARSINNYHPFVKRTLRLDETSLVNYLSSAATNTYSNKTLSNNTLSKDIAAKIIEKELDLPLPNDEFIRVKVIDVNLLSKELQDTYPNTRAWKVVGVDDPSVTGRIDITSNGFHGMLKLANGDTVYIDPEKSSTDLYSSFSKKLNVEHFKTEFNCDLHDSHSELSFASRPATAAKILAKSPTQNLITYRLAVAGTAEYTGSQGGTSASAYASMVTTINRVNEVYERDLGIKLQLVSDESIVYTDVSSDPYTNNNVLSLVTENIDNLNNTVGAENYDIGHVFAQGSLGGLAFSASACQDDYKAGGATGTQTPNGETFSVEYVAHELGHQLGATHTFNSQQSSCSGSSRVQRTAVEPGSGSTIMSYSGLCGTDNIQTVSDAVFHWASINQITEYTNNATGSTCGLRTSKEYNDLSANAHEDTKIPANTPFMLKGATSGGVSYSWDQIDAGEASLVTEDLGENAIIRSLLPNSETSRYVPSLENLFNGTMPVGETLPKVNRELNFAFLARGEKGGIATDFKMLSVTDSGTAFKVISHSDPEVLQQGQETAIEWDVAGTNAAPINCGLVDIQLIRANGVINVLIENTPNDGYENVTIPSTTPDMQDARIMVACNNDSFFNVSSANLVIGESFVEKSEVTTSGGGSFGFMLWFLFLLSAVKSNLTIRVEKE